MADRDHMQERRHWRTREDEVADMAVWNCIRYLDSFTDYRECLPGAEVRVPRQQKAPSAESEMVILDDMRTTRWIGTIIAILLATMVSLILLLAFRP
jgi:hypothetical protein